MGKQVEQINDNAIVECKGNLTVLGNIGKNATVTIKDGGLTVMGNIESDTNITVEQPNRSISITSQSIFIGGVTVSGVGRSSDENVTIHGNVNGKVTISSQSANIIVVGTIGNECHFKTRSGDIRVEGVGNNSVLKSTSGDIKTGHIGTECTIKTTSGDIKTENVGSKSKIKSTSGDITVKKADESVSIKTTSGDITENGVKRRTEKKGGTISVSFGNRFIVNGRDVTSLFDSIATEDDSSEEELIIRNKK